MATSSNSQLSILRLSKLTVKIGLGKSAIYDRLDPNSPRYDANFPRPIKLGEGKNPPIGFLESEIDGWINAQLLRSRSTPMFAVTAPMPGTGKVLLAEVDKVIATKEPCL